MCYLFSIYPRICVPKWSIDLRAPSVDHTRHVVLVPRQIHFCGWLLYPWRCWFVVFAITVHFNLIGSVPDGCFLHSLSLSLFIQVIGIYSFSLCLFLGRPYFWFVSFSLSLSLSLSLYTPALISPCFILFLFVFTPPRSCLYVSITLSLALSLHPSLSLSLFPVYHSCVCE